MDVDSSENLESQDSNDNEINQSTFETESDSDSDSSDGSPVFKYATGLDHLDGPDESSDPYLAYSTCYVCYKILKVRCFPEVCLHKFCFKCSEQLTLRTRYKLNKRKCPVCRKSYKFLRMLNVPTTDDEWKNVAGFTWKRHSYDFRKKIYAENLWVQDLASVSEKFREFTPQFYKDNLLQVQRLIPWLEREVNVLLDFSESNATQDNIIRIIKDLLSQFSIKSSEFTSAAQPFLGSQMDHFVHEFYMFACSCYDIHSFDDHAFYLTNAEGGQLSKANMYSYFQFRRKF